MKITLFEDLDCWQEARTLVKLIYETFSKNRDFGFRDQIQRASVSIMTNIAEGFDRGTNKEFMQFLVISRGSASEVKSLLYTAQDLGYINERTFHNLSEHCEKITALINGLLKYLRNSPRKQ